MENGERNESSSSRENFQRLFNSSEGDTNEAHTSTDQRMHGVRSTTNNNVGKPTPSHHKAAPQGGSTRRLPGAPSPTGMFPAWISPAGQERRRPPLAVAGAGILDSARFPQRAPRQSHDARPRRCVSLCCCSPPRREKCRPPECLPGRPAPKRGRVEEVCDRAADNPGGLLLQAGTYGKRVPFFPRVLKACPRQVQAPSASPRPKSEVRYPLL